MSRRSEREVVLHHTAEWFKHSVWSMEKFALEALAPALANAGLIEPLAAPESGVEYSRSRKAWGQQVARLFNGDKTFPLEWKWIWISLVPNPYHDAMTNELQSLAGCMNVALPEIRSINGVKSAQARMGAVMIEVGEFFTATAGPAGDGRYDRDDQAEAVETMQKGLEAVQAILAELAAVSAGTGVDLPALSLFGLAARAQAVA